MSSKSIAVDAVLGEVPSERGLRISDRIFAALFNHLVYPQIWEDPEVDLQALQLQDGEHVVAIASGGCNLLNMLTAAEIRISALDLSRAHIALNHLKHAALRGLDQHEDFLALVTPINARTVRVTSKRLPPISTKPAARIGRSGHPLPAALMPSPRISIPKGYLGASSARATSRLVSSA
jgi:S-adenosylmethionine:diacylglycerol 3-amino-3-carboxypropyl transferase